MTEYGAVWTNPAQKLDEIWQASETPEVALKNALSHGFYSQYTSYRQREFIENVVDWQIELLTDWLGPNLQHLPEELDELQIVSDGILLVERNARRVSPDLLRNLWYTLFLCHGEEPRLESNVTNILEIGSGYGSFARCIKAYRPSACIWLVDLRESLTFSYTYLKAAYPESRFALVDSVDTQLLDSANYDFILISIEAADYLIGRHFDLAVNMWSLGEMPNKWIDYWFDLLQAKCQVDRLFLINNFMTPLTVKHTQIAAEGDWLFQIDNCWEVETFDIDPDIHTCPLIRNFPTGLGIYGQRVTNSDELNRLKANASSAVKHVLLEDWTTIVAAGNRISNLARPETDLSGLSSVDEGSNSKSATMLKVTQLLEITNYVGRPRIESGADCTLYRLWNDFRVNADPLSGGFLVAYLAMVYKSDLQHRCSKEEIFLLKRLPKGILHDEYVTLLG
jgi:hypothetical protein